MDGQTIVLSRQCLQCIPQDSVQLSGAVKELDLSVNRGISLDGSLHAFRNVEKLDVSDCKLKSFPDDIRTLEKLEELNLSCNEDLTVLPDNLPLMRCLRKLNLRKCGISALPCWITTSESLEDLDLSENCRLSCLPSSIAGLQSLRVLRLNQCAIKEIPSWIVELKNLEILDLSWNSRLSAFPQGQCLLAKLRTLNIGNCNVKEIPPWIEHLRSLEELDLFSSKDLAQLPDWLFTLRLLKKLRLRRCSITALPYLMGNLESLEELDLTENTKLSRLPAHIMGLQALRILRLKQCGLTELPSWIIKLKNLETLDFSWNKDISTLPDGPCDLNKLSTLIASKCSLTELPLWFGQLQKLEILDLSENRKLGRLPDGLMRLRQLKKLCLKWCDFKALPDWIGHLELLQDLDASRNAKLSHLPESLAKLNQLKKLVVYLCNLSQVPQWIGDLSTLEDFEVSRNKKITWLPESMKKLQQLKSLQLRSCYFAELPSWIGQLHNLEELNAFENRNISSLPESLSQLKVLKKLSLGRCSLSGIPSWFKELVSLEDLDLSDNKLKSFPGVTLELRKLQRLDLRNVYFQNGQENRITELPVTLLNSPLRELSLEGNPVVTPPEEIWQQGMHAIRSYLDGMLFGSNSLCADTVNMLGDTGAGKTSIARSLEAACPTPAKDDDRTRVMEQRKARIGVNMVNINDFGGHEIYQAVFPVFLPSGGLCILPFNLVDPKVKQEESVKKWLATILAKSKRLRVIIVGTRADQLAEDECRRREDEMDTFVRNFFRCCQKEITTALESDRQSEDTEAANQLRNMSQAVHNAEYWVKTLSCTEHKMQQKLLELCSLVSEKLNRPECLPNPWCQFVNELLRAQSTSAFSIYCTWEEVLRIRNKYLGLDKNDETLKIILRYLVKTSHIVWLEHNPKLCQIVYNNPRRIIELCKQVLHHNESEEMKKSIGSDSLYERYLDDYKRGIVSQKFIACMLQQFSDDQAHDFVDVVKTTIEFMENFNLLCSMKSTDIGNQFCMIGNILALKKEPISNSPCGIDNNRYMPNITVSFIFVGSLLPMRFFEINVMKVMSMVRESLQADCKITEDELTFCSSCVYVSLLRKDEMVILKAHATKDSIKTALLRLCKVFYPALRCIIENINEMWNGAHPWCTIDCPACTSSGIDTKTGLQMKGKRKNIAIGKLNSLPPDDLWHCNVCKRNIPRSLIWPLSPDELNPQDEKDVETFFDELRLSPLIKRLRAARPDLVLDIDSITLSQIQDHFLAAREGKGLLSYQQKQHIQSIEKRSDRVRAFLDAVEYNGDEAIDLLIQQLEKVLERPDLAERLRNQTSL